MIRRRRQPSAAALTMWIVAFSVILAALIPPAVVSGETGNTFMLSSLVAATITLVLLDGVAIGLMLRARKS